MNALLDQFLSEVRDSLQGISEKLMNLEESPDDSTLMNELFRLVHTLKGNSGLFDFPEMTRVLHASEDLMSVVRNGNLGYSRTLADQLMDAMDFIAVLCDGIEMGKQVDAARVADSMHLAESLRDLIPPVEKPAATSCDDLLARITPEPVSTKETTTAIESALCVIPEVSRMAAFRQAQSGKPVFLVTYSPAEDCFFRGADPLFTVLQSPDRIWGRILARESWPAIADLNTYRCVLDFQTLVASSRDSIMEHYRYVIDQVVIDEIRALDLIALEGSPDGSPDGAPNGGPADEDFVSDSLMHLKSNNINALRQGTETMLGLSVPGSWTASVLRWMLVLVDDLPANDRTLARLIESLTTQSKPHWDEAEETVAELVALGQTDSLSEAQLEVRDSIFGAQRRILMLADRPAWYLGRLLSVARVLVNCSCAVGDSAAQREVEAALVHAVDTETSTALLAWLDSYEAKQPGRIKVLPEADMVQVRAMDKDTLNGGSEAISPAEVRKFGRRAEDSIVIAKSLKVDQAKIDRLMNLIGEMVVSKNALPYLAQRAETQYGVRELSRDIKAQYAVINRIAEELQDAIMQVRMMPVSFVFQRFPRMVREISRKLGKEINLQLIGEDTEIDKNIIESLADPLIHVIRNSIDHGIELPAVRCTLGKPPEGKIILRASQDADRVIIEISDDGKGIDPQVMKRKAYEKGFIDENTMERMSDREAINLVFAAGLSTADAVSDLSGRGVGMDVVRNAVDKCNGSITLESEPGKGTTIQISLPLSMAVTQVMIIKSDGQLFGVPMDYVVETVRIPRNMIRSIKHARTTMLRGQLVPLKSLNKQLGLSAEPLVNPDNEIAVLVVKLGTESVGLMVDDFRETLGIIQKPLEGAMGRIAAYSGSAIIGDGSVLMILNLKEVL